MVDGVKAELKKTVEGQALDAEDRVRLFVQLFDHPNISGEIVSHDLFRSDDWPRRMYALWRNDLVEVLNDLSRYEEVLDEANERAIKQAKRLAEVEKAVSVVHERLVRFLEKGLRIGTVPAIDTVQELLQGLPGIMPLETKSHPQPPNLPKIGTLLEFKDCKPHEAQGSLKGELESYTEEGGFWVRYEDGVGIKYANAAITSFRQLSS